MADDIVQVIQDAREDAVSLSQFIYYPASTMVERRLAPSIHTLNYYLDYLHGLELIYSQPTGTVIVNGEEIKTVRQAINDSVDSVILGNYQTQLESEIDSEVVRATNREDTIESALNGEVIRATGVEGGLSQDLSNLSLEVDAQKLDTGITATAKFGGVERSQADINSDVISVKGFATLAEAQAAAIANNIKIFIPTGEHEYDLTNVDMTLFWGYGQLKDITTGAIYKPKNGDFVTPEMFGVDSSKVIPAALVNKIIRYASDNKMKLVWKSGVTYSIRGQIGAGNAELHIDWSSSGSERAVIQNHLDSAANPIDFINIVGLSTSPSLKSTIGTYKCRATTKGTNVLNVVNSADINVGSLLHLKSTRLFQGSESRGEFTEGQVVKVTEIINATSVMLECPVLIDIIDFQTVTGTVTNYVGKYKFTLSSEFGSLPKNWRNTRITAGSSTQYIYENNTTTREVVFNEQWRKSMLDVAVGTEFTAYAGVYYDVLANNSLKIDNIDITRNLLDTEFETKGNGAILRNFTNPVITNTNVSKFPGMGYQLFACYGGYAAHNHFSELNHESYGGGIEIESCSNFHAYRNTSTNSRRCVDVTGSVGFSFGCVLSFNTAYGGGRTHRAGGYFKPVGDRYNNCVASHGGSVGTIFNNNVGYNIEQVVSNRGFDEVVTNTYAYGACKYIVYTGGGGGTIVDGAYYKTGYAIHGNLSQSASDRYYQPPYEGLDLYESDGSPVTYMRSAIGIDYTGMVEGKEVVVKNVYADLVFKAGIEVTCKATAIPRLTFGGVSVTVKPLGGDAAALLLLNGDAQVSWDSIVDLGGNNISTDKALGNAKVYHYGVSYEHAKTELVTPNNMKIHEKTVFLTIPSQSAVSIPVNFAPYTRVSLMETSDLSLLKTYSVSNLQIRDKAAAGFINGEPYAPAESLRIANVPLSGSTGADTCVTVSLYSGVFYIENRTVKTIKPLVTVY